MEEARAYVKFFTGAREQLEDGSALVVGRSLTRNNDARVSRKHCSFHFYKASGTVVVQTLSSVNKVFVWKRNGTVVVVNPNESHPVQDNERVSLVAKDFFIDVEIQKPLSMLSYAQGSMIVDDMATQEVLTQLDEDAADVIASVAPQSVTGKRSSPAPASPAKRPQKMTRAKTSWLEPQLEISVSELKFEKKIGLGSCGEVWKADWNGNRVAVKKIFRALLSDSALTEFRSEAKIMQRIRHPNVVQFWGFSKDGDTNMLVTEFMPKGALSDVLYDQNLLMDDAMRLHIAIGAAKGVDYLHKQNIVHRDLKTMNYLVDDTYQVKVSDFGLSRHVSDQGNAKTFCGTMPWTAPEVFMGKPYTTKVDVYSFGIVLWEILVRQEPYKGLAQGQIVQGVITGALRPQLPSGMSTKMQSYEKLMTRCWAGEPSERPTMSEVLQTLQWIESGDEERVISHMNDARSHSGDEMALTLAKRPTIDWRIAKNDLKFAEKISASEKSAIYLGQLAGRRVRIRAIKHRGSGFEAEFESEMDLISSVRDQHIAYCFGGMVQPQGGCVVHEYFPSGSLYDLMRNDSIRFTMSDVLTLAQEAARALFDLHNWSPPVAHGGITSSKFLIQDITTPVPMRQLKICDFGHRRHYTFDEIRQVELLEERHLVYLAPECFVEAGAGLEGDIYALGIVLWELIVRTCVSRYVSPVTLVGKRSKLNFARGVVNGSVRPMLPQGVSPAFVELLAAMLEKNKHLRPSAGQLSQHLQQIRENGLF